jgi:transposase
VFYIPFPILRRTIPSRPEHPAQSFEVSVSFVIKLMRRWRQTGSLAAKPMGGSKTYALAEYGALVQELVAAKPDITLDELWHRAEDCRQHPVRHYAW